MIEELDLLISKLTSYNITQLKIIDWASPIPSFGNYSTAQIATLGLNPSNLEFVDKDGRELEGSKRRFPTLKFLNLSSWEKVEIRHLEVIKTFCEDYFVRNPYNDWFKPLDRLVSNTSISYYFPNGKACHLDLVPYATICKWNELTEKQKDFLLSLSEEVLGKLLQNSTISILILNGQTVINNFQRITNKALIKTLKETWNLPRKNKIGVPGFSYEGIVQKVGNVSLKREIHVLGYNHNIQGSLGVTTQVKTAIRNWITEKTQHIINETKG